MKNREFLMLSKVFDPKWGVGGWFVSEKLDGMRCFWDGGVSRGVKSGDVPWGNGQRIATGLWSRYAKVISAPDWFLDLLPMGLPLDGELWIKRGGWEQVMSVVKDHNPGTGWLEVGFVVFDSPCLEDVFEPGKINNINLKMTIGRECLDWIKERGYGLGERRLFTDIVSWLKLATFWSDWVRLLEQEQLPYHTGLALTTVDGIMDRVVRNGGEGVMLRKGDSIWEPKRSNCLLKMKPSIDSEGEVVGMIWGEGKYYGMLGSLVIDWNGVRFNLSGFTDKEREIKGEPGVDGIGYFKIGDIVTFRYREVSSAGIPKEARYFRKG